jgi:hypothetical protein
MAEPKLGQKVEVRVNFREFIATYERHDYIHGLYIWRETYPNSPWCVIVEGSHRWRPFNTDFDKDPTDYAEEDDDDLEGEES